MRHPLVGQEGVFSGGPPLRHQDPHTRPPFLTVGACPERRAAAGGTRRRARGALAASLLARPSSPYDLYRGQRLKRCGNDSFDIVI
jgi:hypothetical protein